MAAITRYEGDVQLIFHHASHLGGAVDHRYAMTFRAR